MLLYLSLLSQFPWEASEKEEIQSVITSGLRSRWSALTLVG
jgi:hypothetical protein